MCDCVWQCGCVGEGLTVCRMWCVGEGLTVYRMWCVGEDSQQVVVCWGHWGRQANKKKIEDILVKVKFDLSCLNVFKLVYSHVFKLVKLGNMVNG